MVHSVAKTSHILSSKYKQGLVHFAMRTKYGTLSYKDQSHFISFVIAEASTLDSEDQQVHSAIETRQFIRT